MGKCPGFSSWLLAGKAATQYCGPCVLMRRGINVDICKGDGKPCNDHSTGSTPHELKSYEGWCKNRLLGLPLKPRAVSGSKGYHIAQTTSSIVQHGFSRI